MDDDDWEELDENAMEECMILATQLCTKQPQQQHQNNNNSTYISKVPQSKSYPETGNKNLTGVYTNASLNNNVRDSGVCSTRSTSLHQSSNINSTVNQRKDVPNNNSYMNRFSDFSAKTTSSHQSLSTSRKQSFGVGKNAGYSKGKSPVKQWPGSDVGAGSHPLLLKKAEEDKAKLDERILVMQGEISILRSELKRKETALETERIDHCAAIENAEKRGREKVAKQTAEADTKLKEKGITLDKLQGELHFKKREVEELLNRCLRLEQQPQASHASEPANKRPRLDKNSLLYGKDGDSSIASRFDFSRRPAKVCVGVGVQTEALQPKDPQRTRLEVTSSKGHVSQTRRIATLLSCSASAHTQHTSSSSSAPSSSSAAASTCISASTESNGSGSDGWSLPAEWLSIISMGLRETDESVDKKLVGVAVERLHQTHSTVSLNDADKCRLTQQPNNPTQWYEAQVGPAIQVLSYFNSSSELSVLQAIIAHLPPLLVKDVMVNKRLRYKLLEGTERISRLLKHPIERNHSEGLTSTLRDCCISLENGTEAGLLLKVAAALSYHCRLCVSSDVCLITHLCKKVKKLCVPEVGVLRALLDLTWSLVKITLPSLWLNTTTTTTSTSTSTTSTSCSCSSQLLGTFIWHIYQTLEAAHLKSNKRKVYCVLSSCIQVLHHWSTVDTNWWEKVSPFPHYPSLMATLAAKAKDIKFDKDTVELLCDLYEFEEGAFES